MQCQKAVGGEGMQQQFQMEVWDMSVHKVIANVTRNSTRFTVSNLPEGSQLQVLVYAHNQRGRGKITSLKTSTLAADPGENGNFRVHVITLCSICLWHTLGGNMILSCYSLNMFKDVTENIEKDGESNIHYVMCLLIMLLLQEFILLRH